jgi:hypothetical protein
MANFGFPEPRLFADVGCDGEMRPLPGRWPVFRYVSCLIGLNDDRFWRIGLLATSTAVHSLRPASVLICH